MTPAWIRAAGVSLLVTAAFLSACSQFSTVDADKNATAMFTVCQRLPPAPPPASAAGPLRVLSSNQRYFTDGSGKAIYLTGSHTWTNFQDIGASPPSTFDYRAYLDFLQTYNHNFIRLWRGENAWEQGVVRLPSPYFRTGPGNASDGKTQI